jgi:hypothetical protein
MARNPQYEGVRVPIHHRDNKKIDRGGWRCDRLRFRQHLPPECCFSDILLFLCFSVVRIIHLFRGKYQRIYVTNFRPRRSPQQKKERGEGLLRGLWAPLTSKNLMECRHHSVAPCVSFQMHQIMLNLRTLTKPPLIFLRILFPFKMLMK